MRHLARDKGQSISVWEDGMTIHEYLKHESKVLLVWVMNGYISSYVIMYDKGNIHSTE